MVDQFLNNIYKEQMTDNDFNRLSQFVFEQSGIKMPPVKRVMLQSRLYKRLRELKISTFKAYADYVFSPEGQKDEIVHMIDVVSTNKTDFFREYGHFEYLRDVILPEFKNSGQRDIFKFWSAGCSSGEEPYSVAITLNEFKSEMYGFNYSILGTDISTIILKKAILAVYAEERIINIPLNLKKKYFLRSKDRESKTVRVVQELRDRVKFQRLNFMNNRYECPDTYDIIFCRNVLIYFNRETQEQVITKLCANLKAGGYLFVGHSESIIGMNFPLKQVKPTIYKKI